jgi:hypothetical protein
MFFSYFFSKMTNQLGMLHCGINSTTHLIRFNMATTHMRHPQSVPTITRLNYVV